MPPAITATTLDDDLLNAVSALQAEHGANRSGSAQKAIGQFFTPAPVARHMASMLVSLPDEVRLLDPGAGAGMLTAAVCERVAALRRPRRLEVHAYETDPELLGPLRRTLGACRGYLADHGHEMVSRIHEADFILGGPALATDGLFAEGGAANFDVVVMNPPYMKVGKNSAHARAMAAVVHGQPNLYAFFMALGASVLAPDGQFVSITPRSFTNGPYFRSFRRWFLERVAISRLHLFESRKDTFADAGVLQESIITYARRSDQPEDRITITHSAGPDAPNNSPALELRADLVVDDSAGAAVIRVPASAMEVRAMRAVESWPRRFEKIGLRVSTGPVVTFRAPDFVRRGEVRGAIPLLSIQNVRAFRTVWPTRKPLSFRITAESQKLLLPSSNYVLLRRFSAKEEERRLTASPVYADTFGAPWIALENHLNYVYHADRKLTKDEVLGVAGLINSRLLDVYFRTISGNTQVNAAEVRAMPFPELEMLRDLGAVLRRADVDDRAAVEAVVLDTLGIDGPLKRFLVGCAQHAEGGGGS